MKRILDEAFKAGRILPVNYKDQEWLDQQLEFAKKDFKKFEAFWAKQPVVGPVQRLPITGDAPSQASGISETDLMIARALGVTEEALKKHNPAA